MCVQSFLLEHAAPVTCKGLMWKFGRYHPKIAAVTLQHKAESNEQTNTARNSKALVRNVCILELFYKKYILQVSHIIHADNHVHNLSYLCPAAKPSISSSVKKRCDLNA